ncbi:hypothetical protein [Paraflavitalea speifideaquila]|uniref:hypothetical protein n=1 Tax=Paraflavitalea speifideaquila TaxID=3076558 RepID=UPI0028E432F6|nr:hypothetical protein [Paraflavitalea speifideiaquila]
MSTIEGHLVQFIGTGEIDIKDLVQEDKNSAHPGSTGRNGWPVCHSSKRKIG